MYILYSRKLSSTILQLFDEHMNMIHAAVSVLRSFFFFFFPAGASNIGRCMYPPCLWSQRFSTVFHGSQRLTTALNGSQRFPAPLNMNMIHPALSVLRSFFSSAGASNIGRCIYPPCLWSKRCSTVFHGPQRFRTALDGFKRLSTPYNTSQRLSTTSNAFQRLLTVSSASQTFFDVY